MKTPFLPIWELQGSFDKEVIASLSLLSPCVMRLQSVQTGQIVDLWLEPTSLLILSGPARHDWTRVIAARKND
jgi:alkylated DNA repair dioxygenase AlkB